MRWKEWKEGSGAWSCGILNGTEEEGREGVEEQVGRYGGWVVTRSRRAERE